MGQKVALAIEIEPFFAKEAKERQIRKPINSVVGHVPTTERSRDRAASAVGLSGKTVSQAKAITVGEGELVMVMDTGMDMVMVMDGGSERDPATWE